MTTPKPQTISPFQADFAKNKTLLNTFQTLLEKYKGDAAKALTELEQHKAVSKQLLKKLHFTHALVNWSGNNEHVVAAFQKEASTNSLRDIAIHFNKAALGKAIPAAAVTKGAAKADLVKKLHTQLFQQEPSAVLVNQIKDQKVPLFNTKAGAATAAVLEKNPDFNIRAHSVYDLLHKENVLKDVAPDLYEAVKANLKSLQRVVRISPEPDAVHQLLAAKFTTGLGVSDLPRKQFVNMMAGHKMEEQTASQVHENAMARRVTGEQAMMGAMETMRGTGVALIDKSLAVSGDITRLITPSSPLNWNALFADADFCECGACTSVYSAASYFVELLQYLRNNNLTPKEGAAATIQIKADASDISGTPLQKLFDRRPDLGCLQLTCANTNTILPYVDLVNEVMEQYIVDKSDLTKLKAFNVTDETSGELLAQPQHTNSDAYYTLSQAVYPLSLPYHQPIDAIRIYLEFLGSSRYELMDTLRAPREMQNNIDPNPLNGDTEITDPDPDPKSVRNVQLDKLHEAYLDRATDAEFLKITQDEHVILTKEAFISNEYWNAQCNKARSISDYQLKINLLPVCNYFGYNDTGKTADQNMAAMLDNDEASQLGLKFVKNQFLPRTGIQYAELVDLLKTQFLNPYMLQGNALAIMDSIPFSYRYLQTLSDGDKLKAITNPGTWAKSSGKEFTKPVVDPCGIGTAIKTFHSKDIEHWIKCSFKKAGKIIVLEDGCQCVDGIFSITNPDHLPIPVLQFKNCQIFSLVRDKHFNQQIGTVNCKTGLITLSEIGQVIISRFKLTVEKGSGNNSVGIIELNNKALGYVTVGTKNKKPVYSIVRTDFTDNCDISTTELIHLDGTELTDREYDRFHRFIRLWHKLGWTIKETDAAVIGFGTKRVPYSPSDDCAYEHQLLSQMVHCDINVNLVHQLVAVKRLLDQTGLELIKLLTLWGNISTAGDNSLYARLFLTHNLIGANKVFQPDDNGNYFNNPSISYTISDNIAALMAVFNLTSRDLNAILNDNSTTINLTTKIDLDNISLIYRYRLMAQLLGLRIADFITAYPIFGYPFESPDTTLSFLENWAKLDETGFSYKQLNYIINGIDDNKLPFAMSQQAVRQLAKAIYDGLNAIDASNSNIDDSDPAAADTDVVKTKLSLLYDQPSVDLIIGVLNGTGIYKTTGPSGVVIDPASNVSKKLKYDGQNIQITGILTPVEEAEFLGFTNTLNQPVKDAWKNALDSIKTQQQNIFKLLLEDVFSSVKDVLLQGDDVAGGNTDFTKRTIFLKTYLPYLRQQLEHKFIVGLLADKTSTTPQIADLLISSVLKVKPGTDVLYTTFESIKSSPAILPTDWSGYLTTANTDVFTFIVKNGNATETPIAFLDDMANSLEFINQPDLNNQPTGEWWTAPIKLQAGKAYAFKLNGTYSSLNDVAWKTAIAMPTAIPASCLLPEIVVTSTEAAYSQLQKAVMLLNGFNLTGDEIKYISNNQTDFTVDFNNFSISQWLRLEAYTRLRNSLPSTNITLIEFFQLAQNKPASILDNLQQLTRWDKETISQLLTSFKEFDAANFKNEICLLQLQNAMAVVDKTGMDVVSLFKWANPTTDFKSVWDIAENIGKTVQAKYNQTDWEQVIKPLNDRLRNNQKDALIAYLLADKTVKQWGVTDANGLFEYFLIDVQMDAVMETSRIVQAISSVQLFVQRCFLGLEAQHSNIANDVLDRDRWSWMQQYRVWEANRKVFLYPENWIESNLRDDKSPFFKELESELLQKDISKRNVIDALKNYLYKVDEVANMEVIGLYIESDPKNGTNWQPGDKLHVFSRTRNAPYFFYYRYLDLTAGNWFAWEKMQVDIPSYDAEDSNRDVEVEIDLNFNYYTNKGKDIITQDGYNTYHKHGVSYDTIIARCQENNYINTGSEIVIDYKGLLVTTDNQPKTYQGPCTIYLNKLNGIAADGIVNLYGLNYTGGKPNIDSVNYGQGSFTGSYVFSQNLLNANINGCYLVPAVWNHRLFVFFPQIVKKTKPNPSSQSSGKFIDLANSNSGIEDSKPIGFYEIKMAWSEYRSGKWTAKQISNDAISTDSNEDGKHSIQHFKFVPIIQDERVIIDVDDFLDTDGGYKGAFSFDGNSLQLVNPIETDPVPINYFNTNSGEIFSWQMQGQFHRVNDGISFNEDSANNEMSSGLGGANDPENFYHPSVKALVGKLNDIDYTSLFLSNLNGNIDKADYFGQYKYESISSYHELKRPYSLYNWELFFHTPLMLANELSKAQQFEEAMKWYHFVFDPMTGNGNDDSRFWQFTPFKQIDSKSILDKIFNALQANTAAGNDIAEWRNNPFMPHVVARNRPVAYMKWVVMKYIDNLVAWGDYLFRQDSMESINQATQLYVLAYHILGQRPQFIPKRGKLKPETYNSLLNKWDAFGNAIVELELVAPFSNQISVPAELNAHDEVQFANIFGFASARYFCIPNNPTLMAYWDTLDDRLFKIRHSENIAGVFRILPLFQPPIDPALLVNAAAQGLSIDSVLNDLNTPMPNYRFYYLLQKALELCNELKALGNAMLSSIEKGDNEAITVIRARHENVMQNLLMEIKKKQVDEAQSALDGLLQNRLLPEARMKYYLQLIGKGTDEVPMDVNGDFTELDNDIEAPVDDSGLNLIAFEEEEMDKATLAADLQVGIGASEQLVGLFGLIPEAAVDLQPFGIGGSVLFGGIELTAAAKAIIEVAKTYSSYVSYQSSNAGRKANFKRALQDRTMQANAAGYEIKQIDKQILSQQIRIAIANQDIANQQKQIENAQEIEDFLKDKYTKTELYSWMQSNLKTLYHQVYSLAYDLAKKAEKTFCFERGLTNSNFIQAGYWNAGRDGLLSGEQLYVGIKQLEAAYQENRGYDYEITKHVSIRQINPLALLQLKNTGTCNFDINEVLFDMDYPGHYKRRIKSVSISVPCIAGPYSGLNATLRLTGNKFRNSTIVTSQYPESTDQDDNRFMSFMVPISAIAASSGQTDSGMFELNFKDERYLPFEGAGAISTWQLDLPAFPQFDYDTITDVVVHIRYTSAEGGAQLKSAASANVLKVNKANETSSLENGLFGIIDLKHDLPTEWHKAMQPITGGPNTLKIPNVSNYLPFFSKSNGLSKVTITDLTIIADTSLVAADFKLTTETPVNSIDFSDVSIGAVKAFAAGNLPPIHPTGNWSLAISNLTSEINKAILIFRYTLS